MSIGSLYDEVAHHYALADHFKTITKTHDVFFEQLKAHAFASAHPKLLDLGVGDGKLLSLLKENYPDAELTGLDRSQKMLELANEIAPMHTVQGDILDAESLLTTQQFDLIIGHFILAFIDLDPLLQLGKQLLPKGGLMSLASSAADSFPNGRAAMDKYSNNSSISGKIFKKLYKRAHASNQLPSDKDYFYTHAKANGFEIVDWQTITIDMHFDNLDFAFDYGFKAGWLPIAINFKGFPNSVVNAVCKFLMRKVVSFPHQDQQVINVVLFKKS